MDEANALLRDGLAHHREGAAAAAERCYRAALAVAPEHAGAWHLLGLLVAGSGGFAEAASCMSRAVERRPEQPFLWGDLGACLYRLDRLDEAEAALRMALSLDRAQPPALGCLGLVLAARGAAAEAEACWREVLALAPDDAAAHTNLGNLLRDRGRLDAAEAMLRRARALRPGADAEHNLAVVLSAAGRLAEAEACCRAALGRDPGHADAHYTLGTTHLLAGRLREGWQGFAWRWRRRGFAPPRRFAQPAWDGAALAGRTLLLYAEQGLGDAIQMLRFVPQVAARGAVVLEVPAALARLAATLAADVTVAVHGTPLPAFDVQCSLMDLPGVLGVGLDDIPAGAPYLAPPSPIGAAPAAPGLGVGLAWAGNPRYLADARRSLPPAKLDALAGIPGLRFVSLQYDARARPALMLHDPTAAFADLADAAAVVAGLDLVIAVDSAIAHLAGALGVEVWLLNRFDTCWRWMLHRADSPWYPTMRIFRQPAPGDWDSVLAEVRAALAGRAGGPPSARG